MAQKTALKHWFCRSRFNSDDLFNLVCVGVKHDKKEMSHVIFLFSKDPT